MAEKRAEQSSNGPPAWLATYSDTMTLLMTFFILLMTFSTTSPFSNLHREHAIVGDQGKDGLTGKPERGIERNSIIWREFSLMKPQQGVKSATVPAHSDAVVPSTGLAVKPFEVVPLGTLSEEFRLRMPLRLLCASDDVVSPSGKTILNALANKIWSLPYDLIVEVGDERNLAKAHLICEHLFKVAKIHPARLGISVNEAEGLGAETVSLKLSRLR